MMVAAVTALFEIAIGGLFAIGIIIAALLFWLGGRR